MSWKVLVYETKSGESPVEAFISSQQDFTQAKIIHTVRLLKEYGPRLGMPHAKMMGKGIYELRIRGKEEVRIFYCFKNRSIFLLHAFKKKSQKTPAHEFVLAEKRSAELTDT